MTHLGLDDCFKHGKTTHVDGQCGECLDEKNKERRIQKQADKRLFLQHPIERQIEILYDQLMGG